MLDIGQGIPYNGYGSVPIESRKGSVASVIGRCKQRVCHIVYIGSRFFIAYFRFAKFRHIENVSAKVPCRLVMFRRSNCELQRLYVYFESMVFIKTIADT